MGKEIGISAQTLLLFILTFLPLVAVPVLADMNTYTSTTVTTTRQQPEKIITVLPQNSLVTSVKIESQLPGKYVIYNYKKSAVSSYITIPDSDGVSVYYPQYIPEEISYGTGGYMKNPVNTRYVSVTNNSDTRFGDYKVSLATNRYEIGIGETINIEKLNDAIIEVMVKADDPGIYQIWHNDPGISVVGAITSEGAPANVYTDSLPNDLDTGEPIGSYITFAVFDPGYFKLYLRISINLVRLTCKYYEPKKIEKDVTYTEGVEPGSAEYLDPSYSLHVMEFEAKTTENVYKYYLHTEFGSPNYYLFYKAMDSYILMGLTSSASIRQLSINTDGKYYLVVDNPDYFSWGGIAGLIVPHPIRFSVKIEEVPIKSISTESSTVIGVSTSSYIEARKFELKEDATVSILFRNLTVSKPTIANGPLYKIEDGYIRTVSTVYKTDFQTVSFIGGYLPKGTYFFVLLHSGSAITEFMDVNITTGAPVHGAINYIKYNETQFNPPDSFFTSWEFNPLYYNTTEDKRFYTAATFYTPLSDILYYPAYNISLDIRDNLWINETKDAPSLGKLWDATNNVFIDYTPYLAEGEPKLVPFKTNGTTNGDAFIIGSPYMFYGMYIDISMPTDLNAFTWEYYDGTGWVPFEVSTHEFEDGTWAPNRTLAKDGIIKWNINNLLASWTPITRTTDSAGLELPSTGGVPMFLVRVSCNDSAAAIPNITSVSLFRYQKLTLSLYFGEAIPMDPVPTTDDVIYDTSQRIVTLNYTPYGADSVLISNYVSILSGRNHIVIPVTLYALIKYYYGTTAASEVAPANNTIKMKICSFGARPYKQFAYDIGDNTVKNATQFINLTTFSGYDAQFSFNATKYPTVLIKLNPSTRYDWTQLIFSVKNGDIANCKLYQDIGTPGYTYTVPTITPAITSVNNSLEFGFIGKTAYLMIQISAGTFNPDYNTTVSIYAAHFGTPMIEYTIENYFIWRDWYTYAIIGAAAGVTVAIIGYKMYKKRHPI